MFKMSLSRLYNGRRHVKLTGRPRGRPPKRIKRVIL